MTTVWDDESEKVKFGGFKGQNRWKPCVSVPEHIINYRKQGGLKQPIFILSHFWRLEIQSQGIHGVGSFWRP